MIKKELEPVHCGCGGEAFVSINGFIEYHVVCALCGMRTDWFYSKDKAIKIWNRAMGTTEKSSTVEQMVKVFEHDASVTDTDGYKYHRSEYLCGACKKKVLSGDDYCSHCGAKLDWSENELSKSN